MKINKGFTLIELMAVVTILGILAAIAIANFMNMMDRARAASVKSNMHTVQLAVEDYCISSNGRYSANVSGFAPYLPQTAGVHGLRNPFNGSTEQPLDGDPVATPGLLNDGQISYGVTITNGTVVMYVIHGFGKDELLELVLTPSSQGN